MTDMTEKTNLSRRTFLKSGAVAAGGLMIGVTLPEAIFAASKKEVMPNAWVRISPDNRITILSARSEMGQGVYTAMPTLVAEELEVDLNKIRVEIAPAGEAYINALLGGQITGGSTSVADGYLKLRVAGAQARTMLVAAAAEKWKVDASACKAANGAVTGPGGKKATYGQLAEAAAKQPVPKDVKLKDPSQWKYVGTPVKRFDTPSKVNGTAEFGIDVRLPGMLYAALAQCPVIGGKAVSFDASKAKGMRGVKQVVQISDGVAVLADSYWNAKQALAAVDIKWDEGALKAVSTEDIVAGLKAASVKPGAVFRKVGDVDVAMKDAAKTLEAAY
jgi:isoquinoline 1-oxidoreductase beta subunit